MIVPMIKYTFAVHHSFYRQFLNDLQELEVVHIDRGRERKLVGEAAELAGEAGQIGHVLEQLKNYRHEQPEEKPTLLPVSDIHARAVSLMKRLGDCRSALELLQETIDAREIWGDYSGQVIRNLNDAGIFIRFYTIPAKKFSQSWLELFPVEVISRSDREVHFICIGKQEVTFEGARELHPPQEQLTELNERHEMLKKEIAEVRSKLEKLANSSWLPLKSRLAVLRDRMDWLDILDNRTSPVGEGQILLLEGWVPVTAKDPLNQYLDEKGILYFESAATEEEVPPVQLVNNRFARLFEPISKLFSLPAYGEMDLTVYFAPFFMLFFGFCLGDAGYGLVILVGTTIGKRFASADMKSYLTLGQFFGLSTMIMGLLFGTFFGIVLADVPALESVRDKFLESESIFYLSMIIGAIQIIFGIVLRIFNQLRQSNPWLALGSAGWLLLFFTAGVFEAWLPATAMTPVLKVLRIFGYSASLFFIIFFSGTGSVFQRLGGGIWEIYGNVTGIFGDLLSYIRLFALGVASSILGLVVNQMAVAFGKAPYIGPVVFFLIILIGHTANLAISSLGAFVHPMRLTFVEFYKNAGFKGGGKAYQPFAKQKNH
ncbi:MAG: V-type ATPase 116kDa subunit family protein [Prolixibacteraceae bacterium]